VGRDLERHRSVDTGCPIVDRPGEVRRAGEILEGQLEEEFLAPPTFR